MLVINGGKSIRQKPFPKQETVGREETKAVKKFMKNGNLLSGFRGSWQEAFWGGPQVQSLELEWWHKFNPDRPHFPSALAVNSCTSALQIACGAVGLHPGDEVIVTPFSMTCSATAPMIWGAVPVFADIERDYFCLDPDSVEERITKKTKAIIAVDLFGQPFNPRLRDIANKHHIPIIEDAAQAPGADWYDFLESEKIIGRKNVRTGFLGDIGCFSFTQGKHLTCGEGGMITTQSQVYKMRCALIRNHAESVINSMQDTQPQTANILANTPNMLGSNLRMTETQAVIMREQLKKLDRFIELRRKNVEKINEMLSDIPFIKPAPTRKDCTHVYYVHAFHYDNEQAGIHRDKFIKAVIAELTGEKGRPDRPLLGCGYIKPLYLMSLFQKRNHFSISKQKASRYKQGICPVAEKLGKDDLFISMYHNLSLSDRDIGDISGAFHKVYENISELK